MRTWAKASTPAALLAVAVMSFGGAGAALADTSGDASVGGGNQVDLPVSLPIDISGNSVAAVGSASASSQGGAEVVNHGRGIPNRTSGDASVLGGNQVNAPISAPINACGNAISLIGKSDAGCKGGATVRNQGKGGAGGNRTSGNASVLGGNQVVAPISAPVNLCGNAVAIFGDATAGCKGGSSVYNTGVGAGGNRTSGNASVLGGNQVVAPISAPVNICGNAIAVAGRAFAGCRGGSTVTNNGGPGSRYQRHAKVGSTGNDTDGRFGVGSGNQVIAPISLPVEACGNAVGNASAGCTGGASVLNSGGGSGAGGNTTSGRAGVLSGNQVIAPVTAPINVCGNAVAVLGQAFAGCKGGAHVKNGGRGAGGNRTSGNAGVLSGNQAVAPITAPINVCGNAAAVLGASEAHCKGGAHAWPHRGVGGGGNRTSGRAGVLAGNQVVAPITAPINVCGNAVAVLGDAAAGCLGGANVGKAGAGSPGLNRFAHATGKAAPPKGGLLPIVPAVPFLSGLQDANGVTQGLRGVTGAAAPLQGGTGLADRLRDTGAVGTQFQDVNSIAQPLQDANTAASAGDMTALPVVGDASRTLPMVQDASKALPVVGEAATSLPVVADASQALGLPQVPELPGLPAEARKPSRTAHAAPADKAGRSRPTNAISPLQPATQLVASTPVGGAVTSATSGLPVSGLGLMSAEQPAGVTGMNSSSLLALMLGSLFAASVMLFGAARRVRFGRK
ncbi:chaplin family protein [Nonomuraea jiangxiensis]|uniref:Small secreted domain n=1 Tax=Nonomuraea jiangxiensis TaxID=633440 RepID=A0A1G8XWT0_9ACTN|nr:chaplin family protein [Nonomuraea jiangxiensis]SDJ94624.1 Small secreted domain [Nonomuraea jiangxiensis]